MYEYIFFFCVGNRFCPWCLCTSQAKYELNEWNNAQSASIITKAIMKLHWVIWFLYFDFWYLVSFIFLYGQSYNSGISWNAQWELKYKNIFSKVFYNTKVGFSLLIDCNGTWRYLLALEEAKSEKKITILKKNVLLEKVLKCWFLWCYL